MPISRFRRCRIKLEGDTLVLNVQRALKEDVAEYGGCCYLVIDQEDEFRIYRIPPEENFELNTWKDEKYYNG